MEKESTELTRDNLVKFLDFVAEKGLMNRQTAVGYKNACSVILKILDSSEAADLSKIDLESIFQRHRNLAAGKILPITLKTYEARTRAAIKAFTEYKKDPSSWKPGIKVRVPKAKSLDASEENKERLQTGEEELTEKDKEFKQPSVHIDLQIHISPDATTQQIDQIFASIRHHLYTK